jgi:osmotically-inducible protein OsmY
VTVSAASGAVTLDGEVPTVAERERIEAIAMDCVGTTSVENRITVEPR